MWPFPSLVSRKSQIFRPKVAKHESNMVTARIQSLRKGNVFNLFVCPQRGRGPFPLHHGLGPLCEQFRVEETLSLIAAWNKCAVGLSSTEMLSC